MGRITLRKEPDGWRVYVFQDNKMSVLDEFFEDEIDAAEAALAYSE
ncbi:MAG TPA: hypothetical protein VFW90_00975 [Candidatus Saccharimonadales bacterium]|nr:hypothetical protein [Candidatus Saccharimonadales bacterium]